MKLLIQGIWIAALVAIVHCSVEVEITAKPEQVESSLTHQLTLSCEARVNASDPDGMQYVSSMIMTHNGEDVASVSGFPVPNGPAMVFDQYKAEVDFAVGSIDPTEVSKLSIRINVPNTNDTGNWSCKAVGANSNYQPLTEFDSVLVKGHSPDNATVLHEIIGLEGMLANLTARIERLERRWPHVDADPVFSRFSMTLGSTYLLSRADMGHAYMAQFICFVQGGYLAEINSQEEADFLQVNMKNSLPAELNGTKDVDVWIGTEKHLETWQHMYNVNDTMHLPWSGSAAKGNDCAALTDRTAFQVEDMDCTGKARVLCEIPVVDEDLFFGIF